MPKLSVIIPVYNGAKYLPDTVQSVLTQSFTDFELLILNDGSTDNSAEYLDDINDKRVRVIHQQNAGLVNSLNCLIQAASGDYIARCDQDDICQPTRFKEQLKAIESASYDAVFCHITKFGANKTWDNKEVQINIGNVIDLDSFTHGCQVHSTLMAKRDLLLKLPYRAEFYPCDDWDLQLRMQQQTKVGILAKPLVKYRFHDEANTYATFFTMQHKRRWAEHCHECRLLNKPEPNLQEFLDAQKNPLINLNRKRKDYYKFASRNLGECYLNGNKLAAIKWALMAGLLAPIKFTKRIIGAIK